VFYIHYQYVTSEYRNRFLTTKYHSLTDPVAKDDWIRGQQ